MRGERGEKKWKRHGAIINGFYYRMAMAKIHLCPFDDFGITHVNVVCVFSSISPRERTKSINVENKKS